ncbi:MAG: hypothetical protein IKB77_00115 [Lentisphaeria bacterium]|nr:hypothetical protein [Lentisphaeria bacterium]
MLKKIFIFAALLLCFCGCRNVTPPFTEENEVLTEKQQNNIEKMRQVIGNKQDVVLMLNKKELADAMADADKFAETVKKFGIKSIGIPFDDADTADLQENSGKEMMDFVMSLYSNSLRCVYVLSENALINHRRGSEFIFGKDNPYRAIILKLKEFWRSLPETAEMPTVVVAIGMNRWNGSNPDRPASLVHVWRKESYGRGGANEMLFRKSFKNFADCRKYLDLEQLVLVADKEVIIAGSGGLLADCTVPEILRRSDALAINLGKIEDNFSSEMNFVGKVKEQGAVFMLVSAENSENFSSWLADLQKVNGFCAENNACAGVWLCGWKNLYNVWRSEK